MSKAYGPAQPPMLSKKLLRGRSSKARCQRVGGMSGLNLKPAPMRCCIARGSATQSPPLLMSMMRGGRSATGSKKKILADLRAPRVRIQKRGTAEYIGENKNVAARNERRKSGVILM